MLRREKATVLAKPEEKTPPPPPSKETQEGAGSTSSSFGQASASTSSTSTGGAGAATSSSATSSSSSGWAGVKHAPTQLGSKNDLIVWIPLRPAQRRLYKKFLKSGPVRAALNKTGSALSAINVLKKICDHPALCLSVAKSTAADAAATSSFTRSPSKSPSSGKGGKGGGGGEEEEGEEKEEDNEGKQAAVMAAVAAAGLTETDLDGDPEASGKAAFLMSLLRHLADAGHRTLVFSQSRAMLDVLEKAARSDGHNLVRIDGNVPADERHARVERFQSDPDIPLALLTSQVGGLGLTLTAADRVVIYDPSWNPASDSQSVDRAYRIGQTRDVVVYRLVTCGTVEEKVYRRQVFKGGLSRAATQVGL